MGMITGTTNLLKKFRDLFKSDKEQVGAEIARGISSPGFGISSDLLSAYGYSALSDYLVLETDLLNRYADYENGDDYPEIAAALDIYADDATQPNIENGRSVWITSPDQNVQESLDDLFHKTLRMEEESWEIARTMCKYGNDFEEILINKDGVVGLNYLPVATVRRVEGERGDLKGFIQDFKGFSARVNPDDFNAALKARIGSSDPSDNESAGIIAFEPWEIAHFRLRGKERRSVYGFSVLESARWILKRLMLLEDTALIYRLQRAPERFAFYVDVGDLPAPEALAFVNKVKQQHKKRRIINQSTGNLDLRSHMLGADEDFFVPVRKGVESTRIDTLSSPQWQHMEDIEYFLDKLFAAIKVPKAYLGQEEGIARAVLSSEDVRFARTTLRVQAALKNGFSKIARTHMIATNIDPTVDFDIHMTVPSAVYELAQLEIRNARADLASRMDEFVSEYWILSNIFQMSDSEIETIVKERGEDEVREARQRAKAEAAESEIRTKREIEDDKLRRAAEEMEESLGIQPVRVEPVRALPSGRVLNGRRSQRITEKELFRGDREAEKRAEGKIEQLLKNDQRLSKDLRNLQSLLKDIHAVAGRR